MSFFFRYYDFTHDFSTLKFSPTPCSYSKSATFFFACQKVNFKEVKKRVKKTSIVHINKPKTIFYEQYSTNSLLLFLYIKRKYETWAWETTNVKVKLHKWYLTEESSWKSKKNKKDTKVKAHHNRKLYMPTSG